MPQADPPRSAVIPGAPRPYLAADLGAIGGGWASGRLVARGWDPIRARLAVIGAEKTHIASSIIR